MFERELRRGRDLDLLHLAQGALGKGREPPQRLDLHVEHVHTHGPLLGRREDVQEASPERELPALGDLIGPLIARPHQLGRALLQVQQVPHAQHEGARPQGRIGHLLRESGRAHDHDRPGLRSSLLGLPGAQQGVQHGQTRRPTRCGGGARWDS